MLSAPSTKLEREVWRDIRSRARRLRPSPLVFYTDCLGHALLGWAALLGLAWLELSWLSPLLLLVSAIAILRAAYFVHEISHRKAGELPLFTALWNAFVGVPLAMPSFMVEPHVDHHSIKTFGTALDPEYEPVAQWSRMQHVVSVLVLFLAPPALVLRWLIVPLGWVVPPLRRLLIERASTMATNIAYRRSLPRGRARARMFALEVLASAYWWLVVGLLAIGLIEPRYALAWWGVTALAIMLNQARTNVAHFYEGDGSAMSLEAQVADSVTLGPGVWTEMLAPVGTRYHALHHQLPRLAYHHLPTIHRELMERLPAGAAYRRTVLPSIGSALLFAWRRAAQRYPVEDRA